MTSTETNTADAGDAGEMPAHLQEAAKQRDEKRKAEELSQLAAKARQAHGIVANSTKVVLQHAINAGNALNEAKDRVDHGKWLAWLEENCPDISNRTAERYMKLADGSPQLEKKLQDTVKFDTMSNLTINEALRLIDEPDGEQSAEVQQTGGQGDASSNGSGKRKNKKKQTEPTADERKEQIENFETDWDGLTDWQKHHFAKKFYDELGDLLRDVEAELGVDEGQEEAEAQPSLS
jgi:hypothetical protein